MKRGKEMRIVVLSDIHGVVSGLPQIAAELEEADWVVLPGDLTAFGGIEAAADVIEAIRHFNTKILAVAGNCDRPECEDYFEEAGINLGGRKTVIEGIEFLGGGGSLPCLAPTPNELTEPELKRALDDLARQRDTNLPCILVSHEPPFNTKADFAWNGQHVGSASVRAFIEQCQPIICFTGHIHEGHSLDEIGETQIINPGSWAQGRYAVAEINGGVPNIKLRTV